MNITVKVEKPSEITRKLTIQVPATVVTQKLEEKYDEIQKTSNLKGFRPGMAPLSVIKQMYGEDAKHKVFHSLIEESLDQATEEHQIKTVGSPKIEAPDNQKGPGEHDHFLEEGKDFNFIATLDIIPTIKVDHYLHIPLTQERTELTDEELEQSIKQFLDNKSKFEPVTSGIVLANGEMSSRPAQNGDFLKIDVIGKLINKQGEFTEKSFRVVLSKDHHLKKYAEQEVEFTITVKEINKKLTPELNDTLAKEAGFNDALDFRVMLKEVLSNSKKNQINEKLKNEIIKYLIEKNPFQVPLILIQTQTKYLIQDFVLRLKEDKHSDEEIKKAAEKNLPFFAQRAEIQVKSSLILETISKKENISVTTNDLDHEIKHIAEDSKIDEQEIRKYYDEKKSRLADLEYRLVQEKTLNFLIDKAAMKN
ncbi:MAG: trigger factor [Deltaproteobacteria bacterium]|nr:trigger factor [Deltaproteobacteria bacterium]